MIITLNQVKQKLREIVLSHAQINSYYWGDISDWTEFNGLVYPSCLVTLNDALTTKPFTTLNLSIWVSGRLLHDGSNVDDVLSDTLQIINDLLSDIDNQDNLWRPELEGKVLNFFSDKMGNDNADVVAGVRVDFAISIITPRDRCQVPHRVTRFIATEQGFEILSENGNVLTPEQ
jgi:hypothetical protein